MIVVADSGPIHYLVLIGDINVMHPLFGRVLIPEAVHRELTRSATPAAVSHWIRSLPSWAEIHSVPTMPEARLERLGPGEQDHPPGSRGFCGLSPHRRRPRALSRRGSACPHHRHHRNSAQRQHGWSNRFPAFVRQAHGHQLSDLVCFPQTDS